MDKYVDTLVTSWVSHSYGHLVIHLYICRVYAVCIIVYILVWKFYTVFMCACLCMLVRLCLCTFIIKHTRIMVFDYVVYVVCSLMLSVCSWFHHHCR